MGETENISKMADKVSDEIFKIFGWEKIGPKNSNFECIYKNEHKKQTHPADVVFKYRHPYNNTSVYINCDLKSYAKQSITRSSIGPAISSLCKTIECARISPEYNKLYLQKGSADINGLLFVYNHDGAYDTDFKHMLQLVDSSHFKIAPGCKVFIMEPFDVCYLNTIANDILKMRGTGELPMQNNCSFFYPNLFGKAAILEGNAPATIEMLLGPWQILRYEKETEKGIVFYVKTHGEKVEEFLYVIDYMVHYQIITFVDKIYLKFPYEMKAASAIFEKAIYEYARQQFDDEDEAKVLVDRLKSKIVYKSVTSVVTSFSDIAIGMEY